MKGGDKMNVEQIARVCHEANKAYCESIGDTSQRCWDDAEQWQRDSAISGVEFALANPNAPASTQHDAWCAGKLAAGWVYGGVKDTDKKTHPCLVKYEDLPLEQRLKDSLFKGVVAGLSKE